MCPACVLVEMSVDSVNDSNPYYTIYNFKCRKCGYTTSETRYNGATCTEDGYELYCCSCGYEEIRKELAIGHEYDLDDWVYESTGHYIRCKKCTNVVMSEPHQAGYDLECGEPANCIICSRVFTQPHSIEHIDEVPATCSSTGIKEHWKCTRCNQLFKDYYGTIKLTASETINKLPHTPNLIIKENEKTATCLKDGSYDEVVYCSICNEEISRTSRTLAKLSHNYRTTIIPATFSASGTITTKCAVGGETTTNTVIPYINTVSLSKTSFTYNKKAQKPSITVKDSKGTVLKNGTDYTITYSNKNSKRVGKYTVAITFKGRYAGTKKLTYTIKPKGTYLNKLTKGSKQFKVTWKAQKTETTGYEVQYALNKKFTSGKKIVNIKSNKTTSKTVKSLKKNKKYYVRIRTYKTVNGKKVYSSYSNIKSIKVK